MKFAKPTKHSCWMIRRAPRRRSFRTRSHRIPAIPTPPPSVESPPPSPRSISSLSTLIIEPQSPISVSSSSTVDYMNPLPILLRDPPLASVIITTGSPQIHNSDLMMTFNEKCSNFLIFNSHTHMHTTNNIYI